MGRTVIRAIAALTMLTGGVLAGPFRRADVSAKAIWVMHVDLDGMRQSSIGKHLLAKAAKQRVAKHFEAAKTIYGVDFRKDLTGVTMYGHITKADGGGAVQHHGVAVIRGKYDKTRFINALKSRVGYTTVEFRGHTLMKVIPADRKLEAGLANQRIRTRTKPGWGAFYDGTTFVLGETLSALKTGVDVLDGKAKSLVTANPFKHLDAIEENPLFMAAANLGQMKGVDPQAAIFRGAESVSLAVREVPTDPDREAAPENATVRAQAIIDGKSKAASEQLRQSLDGLVAIALLGAEKEPLFADLARGVKIRQDGLTVTVGFTHQVDELTQKMDQLENKLAPVLRLKRPQ